MKEVLKISELGMKVWEELMDVGGKRLGLGKWWESNVREVMGWIDENEGCGKEELVGRRRKWLCSEEFVKLWSDGRLDLERVERDVEWFKKGIKRCIKEGWVIES